MASETSEYTVLSPIKVVGEEIPKEERPVALPGQRQRTHEHKVVSTGTVNLSDEDAAPLLDAGAIAPIDQDLSRAHDPEVVGYEGQTGAVTEGLGDASVGPNAESVTTITTPAVDPATTAAGTTGGASASLVELVGEGPATALAEKGITTVERAAAASDEELDAIPGVGTKTIEKIRAAQG